MEVGWSTLWHHGDVSWCAVLHAWPLVLWGFLLAVLTAVILRVAHRERITESVLESSWFMRFKRGISISFIAGIFEELVFRVLLFMSSMAIVTFLNFISFGLLEKFYANFFGPLIDTLSFHELHTQLIEQSWVVGFSIVLIAILFGLAHLSIDWVTCINTTILAFVFFWLMFNYGIVTAMVVHVLLSIYEPE